MPELPEIFNSWFFISLLEDFKAIATNLLQNPELEEAFGLVQQANRVLESGTEALFRKSQLLGRTIHTRYMQPDAQLWERCDREGSRGPEYRDRVLQHHQDWFTDDRDNITPRSQTLTDLVEKEWQEILE